MAARRQNENVLGTRRPAVGAHALKKVSGPDENSIARAKAPRASSKTLALGNKPPASEPKAESGKAQNAKLEKASTAKPTATRRSALSAVFGTPLRPVLASKQASAGQSTSITTKHSQKSAAKPTPRLKSSIPVATPSTKARVPASAAKTKKTLSIYTPSKEASKTQKKGTHSTLEYMPSPVRERDYQPLAMEISREDDDIFTMPSEPDLDLGLDMGPDEPSLMRPELGPDLDLDLDLDLSLKLDDEPLVI
ncbi:hypothetical protein I350_01179 [Cryptococcus amylolentus CBS 6273]|uniref:Uncharacterized protein n=1 Tax=Cryptococcus amylolentus CBS 6273 TaxID=1296118 RepID=A0A1E3KE78_9TREE|nr:hypothetical protein I350_01179 [Cryptococcus amylolentus CBS 6273]